MQNINENESPMFEFVKSGDVENVLKELRKEERYFIPAIVDMLESVLHIFEEQFPDDKRPRKSIELLQLLNKGKIPREYFSDAEDDARKSQTKAFAVLCDHYRKNYINYAFVGYDAYEYRTDTGSICWAIENEDYYSLVGFYVKHEEDTLTEDIKAKYYAAIESDEVLEKLRRAYSVAEAVVDACMYIADYYTYSRAFSSYMYENIFIYFNIILRASRAIHSKTYMDNQFEILQKYNIYDEDTSWMAKVAATSNDSEENPIL